MGAHCMHRQQATTQHHSFVEHIVEQRQVQPYHVFVWLHKARDRRPCEVAKPRRDARIEMRDFASHHLRHRTSEPLDGKPVSHGLEAAQRLTVRISPLLPEQAVVDVPVEETR